MTQGMATTTHDDDNDDDDDDDDDYYNDAVSEAVLVRSVGALTLY